MLDNSTTFSGYHLIGNTNLTCRSYPLKKGSCFNSYFVQQNVRSPACNPAVFVGAQIRPLRVFSLKQQIFVMVVTVCCPPGTFLAVLQGHETCDEAARHLCAKGQSGVRKPRVPTVVADGLCVFGPGSSSWSNRLSDTTVQAEPVVRQGNGWDQILWSQNTGHFFSGHQ